MAWAPESESASATSSALGLACGRWCRTGRQWASNSWLRYVIGLGRWRIIGANGAFVRNHGLGLGLPESHRPQKAIASRTPGKAGTLLAIHRGRDVCCVVLPFGHRRSSRVGLETTWGRWWPPNDGKTRSVAIWEAPMLGALTSAWWGLRSACAMSHAR